MFYPDSDLWSSSFTYLNGTGDILSYQLFKNGSFNSLWSNGTTFNHTLQTVSNSSNASLHYWVNNDGTQNAYWSPAYWADQGDVTGLGLYWNGASWIQGNYTT